MVEETVYSRAAYPFCAEFYEAVIASQPFDLVSSKVVPADHGYGFRVDPGQTFRFTMIEDAQILDTCILSADDPREQFFPGAQLAIEGFTITRLTRLWGTPPLSRPLATCIADTVSHSPNPQHLRDHFSHTAYCTQHTRRLFGQPNRNSCYDNFREGMAMIGLSQRYIPDNFNLFMRGAIDPLTGAVRTGRSNAQCGDYIEFYVEVPLLCVLSICPGGAGGEGSLVERIVTEPDVHPVRVDIYSTGLAPLGWPY